MIRRHEPLGSMKEGMTHVNKTWYLRFFCIHDSWRNCYRRLCFRSINHFGFIIDYAQLSATHALLFGILLTYVAMLLMLLLDECGLISFTPKTFLKRQLMNSTREILLSKFRSRRWIGISFLHTSKNKAWRLQTLLIKLNAQSKMLKNSGFGVLVFSIIFLVEFFLFKVSDKQLVIKYCLPCNCNYFSQTGCKVSHLVLCFDLSILCWLIAEPDFLPVKINAKDKRES